MLPNKAFAKQPFRHGGGSSKLNRRPGTSEKDRPSIDTGGTENVPPGFPILPMSGSIATDKNRRRNLMQVTPSTFRSFRATLRPKSGVFFDDLSAVVVAAVTAQTMRAFVFAALRAFYQRRSVDLPKIIASFVTPGLRTFSLGYRHGQHLLNGIKLVD
jgi:hypothetical protein